MELKVWDNKTKAYQIVRILTIVVLLVLLTFYILKFKAFNEYLVSLNPWKVIPHGIWVLFTKFLSYCLHIAINFCILLVITTRLKYSLWLVYTSFALLFAGAIVVWAGNMTNITVPAAIIAIFVAGNKSLVLLVLFTAGHFVERLNTNKK